MMERIFNFKKNMDQGKEKNHLYDELDEEQKQSEFTEADLKIDEKVARIEFDKNTPQKIKKTAQEEIMNPYTNPYLDADLSTTIGKTKANRKQINTDQFLINKTNLGPQEDSNTEDTT